MLLAEGGLHDLHRRLSRRDGKPPAAAPTERGGRVLGITMDQFKTEPKRLISPEKVASPHFYDRLQHLITHSVGFIAISRRHGHGEPSLSLVWKQNSKTRVIEPRPLVLAW